MSDQSIHRQPNSLAAQVVCNRCSLRRLRLHGQDDEDDTNQTSQSDRVRVCDYCAADIEEEEDDQAEARDNAGTPIMNQLRDQIQRNSAG